jgi:hypothetical protein
LTWSDAQLIVVLSQRAALPGLKATTTVFAGTTAGKRSRCVPAEGSAAGWAVTGSAGPRDRRHVVISMSGFPARRAPGAARGVRRSKRDLTCNSHCGLRQHFGRSPYWLRRASLCRSSLAAPAAARRACDRQAGPGRWYDGVDRQRLLLLRITLVHMSSVATKQRLYRAIVERLREAGVRPEDILIAWSRSASRTGMRANSERLDNNR